MMAKDMGLECNGLDGGDLTQGNLNRQELAPDRSAQGRDDSARYLARDRRSPEAMLQQLSPELRTALSPSQLAELHSLLAQALPQPQPKILDIRFGINLLFDRYYLVLFMGKDQRRRSRQSRLSRLSHWLTAALLLLSLNVFVSLTLGMALYLLKSAAGIDLFPGHLSDRIQSL